MFLAKPRKKPLTVSSSSNPAGAKQATNNPQGPVAEAKINISRLAQFFMPGLWHFTESLEVWAKKLADVVSRFSVNWYAVAAPLVVARWEVMLHLGALFLAAGAVAGMYFGDSFKAIKRSGAARSLRANRPSSPLSTRSLVQVSWYPTCSSWIGRRNRCHPPAFTARRQSRRVDSSFHDYGIAHNRDPAGGAGRRGNGETSSGGAATSPLGWIPIMARSSKLPCAR